MQMIDVLKRLAELDAKNPNVVKEQGVAESSDSLELDNQVKVYKERLESLFAEKKDNLKKFQEQGMDFQAAFSAAEKIYGAGYQKLLKDMPEAHEAYVHALNKEMWAGNKWERDPLSGRSAVDEQGAAEDSDNADQIVSMIDNELEMGNHYEGAVISTSDELDMDPREVDRIYRASSSDSDAIPPINFGLDQDPRGMMEGLNECGMMGSDMSRPRTPASINMTADSGAELTGMLRDIMQLAGLKQVGPDDLGHDHEPHVISTDPSLGAAKMDGEPMDMKSMLATIDTLNKPDDEEEMKEYSNDAPTDVAGDMDNEAMLNTGMHNHDQSGGQGSAKGRNFKNNAVAYPETMYENLMAEYRKFVNED